MIHGDSVGEMDLVLCLRKMYCMYLCWTIVCKNKLQHGDIKVLLCSTLLCTVKPDVEVWVLVKPHFGLQIPPA